MMNKITQFFLNLGFSQEESKIYTTLLKDGPQTVLQLSRNTNINRTTLYRILDRLHTQKLVEEIIEEYKKLYKAVDFHTINLLVKEQENRAHYLKTAFPEINALLTSSGSSQPGTKVVFYRGNDGIKQMAWNTLKANKVCLGYTYREFEEVVGRKFAQDWKQEFVNRNLILREIYSDELFKSKKKGYQGTTYPTTNFVERYIPSKILNINHQMDIYNDVIGIYNWHEGEVFGVEIYNEKVATMHKQLFEIVWNIAKIPPKNIKL
ncbi:hypothetical protein CO083_00040 [Candidatus Roizmanbacteria bacterium CG_4_9_14_0_8_um_filter_34_12]|uniref:Transcription regulator TrmB N-terminal domain-containing protein n=2 Tax=Candidatus Roizmaniibacteriota TaxID=1752723 RepID=A0A2M7E5F6_9BACT|nr:MAG: hypothetical protein COS12_00405 [Candidatus Roizmanbacteria bacterium CG01_land_8_20_14_3_00_33_9]PJB89747.1 MAG: hypothetical protein CO083_00040 [Candidatus Roizmanbacteria bacterium CG_4_9_14_0_8_um_filter_34_12]